MGNHVVVVPPVRPAALLAHVLAHCTHPTTLVICSTSADFVQACVDDDADDDTNGASRVSLHTISLLQVAVARHIRVAFVPTVAHLRGFLASLNLAASRVAAPPAILRSSGGLPVMKGDHVLVVYDLLRLHRDTSEWSGQGLSASAAVLVEAGWRTGLDVLVMESGHTEAGETGTVFDEKAPLLSTAPRRQLQRAGYPLQTERVRTVLKRWFTFRQHWEGGEGEDRKGDGRAVEIPLQAHDEEGVPQQRDNQDTTVDTVDAVQDVETIEVVEEVTPAEELKDVDVVQTVQTVEYRPTKVFVKDSEDEDDDGLSDDEALYP